MHNCTLVALISLRPFDTLRVTWENRGLRAGASSGWLTGRGFRATLAVLPGRLISYIRPMSPQTPTYHLGPGFDDKLTQFVDKLLVDGFETFQTEFTNLPGFIAAALADKSDRNDHGLRRSPKELYLLEAISFKLYDRLNREAFNQADNTLIILPDGLSLHNPDCLKTDEPYGDICQQCAADCQANEICELGERYGVESVFSKRKLTEQIKHFADQSGDLAVIGVACLLMLAQGMRAADEVGVPTRGILLSYTGCEHWNDEAFASSLPLTQLEAILKEKYGQ